MKVYVAARYFDKDKVRSVYEKFQELGYEVPTDWTQYEALKPYNNNPEKTQDCSVDFILSARDCDVFVLLCNEEVGAGMHVELGVAISSQLEGGKPRIYVVGECNTDSMFYFHPSVERRANIEDVLAEVKDLG